MTILPPPKSVKIARKHLQRERFFPNRSQDDLKGEVESIGIYDESGAKQISENAKNAPRGRLERNIWQQLVAVLHKFTFSHFTWDPAARGSVAVCQCIAMMQCPAVWQTVQ